MGPDPADAGRVRLLGRRPHRRLRGVAEACGSRATRSSGTGRRRSGSNALSPPELRIAFEDHIRTVAGHYRRRVLRLGRRQRGDRRQPAGAAQHGLLARPRARLRRRGLPPRAQGRPRRPAHLQRLRGRGPQPQVERRLQPREGPEAARGLVDGVGLQMHISASSFPAVADIQANIQRLADLGLQVNISEMDVRVRDVPGTRPRSSQRQRQVYQDVVAACVAVAALRGGHALGLHGRPHLGRRRLRRRRPAALRRAVPGQAGLLRRRGRLPASSGGRYNLALATAGLFPAPRTEGLHEARVPARRPRPPRLSPHPRSLPLPRRPRCPASGASSWTSRGSPWPTSTSRSSSMGSPKRTYHVKTNRKGGFVRIGLDEGSYKIFLTKEGYKKGGLDVPWLSLGGLSDLCSNNPGKDQPCEPLILKKAEVAIAIGGAPAGPPPRPAAAGAGRAAGRRGAGRQPRRPRRPPGSGPRTRRPSRRSRPSQWDAAEAALKEVLAAVPDQPVVHFNLGPHLPAEEGLPRGRGRVPEGDGARAREARRLRRAGGALRGPGQGRRRRWGAQKNAAAFEQDAKYQIALGATAMNQGKEKEAEAAFSKAVALDPAATSRSQYFLASLALNRNEVADAIAHLEKYIAGGAGATSAERGGGEGLLRPPCRRRRSSRRPHPRALSPAGGPSTCVSGWWDFQACQKPVVAGTAREASGPARGPDRACPVERVPRRPRLGVDHAVARPARSSACGLPTRRLQTSAVVRSALRKTTIGAASQERRSRPGCCASARSRKAAELVRPSSPTTQSPRRGGPAPASTTRRIRASSSSKPRSASSGAT